MSSFSSRERGGNALKDPTIPLNELKELIQEYCGGKVEINTLDSNQMEADV